jgi:SRSO17 transposase
MASWVNSTGRRMLVVTTTTDLPTTWSNWCGQRLLSLSRLRGIMVSIDRDWFSAPNYPAVTKPVELSWFCEALFSSFSRSDQRRWGEIYVSGLASIAGRKSVRRISESVAGGRADQCLQQFVNQSPWEWEPVRLRLAHHLAAVLRPKAWVVREAVFPKNGDSSVGVAKQYAHSAGTVLNCQLGLVLLLAGDGGSCPVNWRLMLPRSWDHGERRERSHLPATERHRGRWQYVLGVVDEMTTSWGLPLAPVVADGRQEPQVEQLLSGLEERGLGYLVQVSETTPVSAQLPMNAVSVGEIVAAPVTYNGLSLFWPDPPAGRPARSPFVVTRVPGAATPYRLGSGRPYPGLRRVIAECGPARRGPAAVWLTNLNVSRLPDLLGLTSLGARAGQDLDRMGDECGLRHFEGRSFRGWHHHTTLASVAQGYRLLQRLM